MKLEVAAAILAETVPLVLYSFGPSRNFGTPGVAALPMLGHRG